MLKQLIGKYLFTLLLTSFSAITLAEWQLNKAQSEISFITTKDAYVSDNHYFTDLEAKISDGGEVEFIINMASVETNIAKRDERLKNILFKVSDYPKAKVNLKVRRGYLKPMPAGSQKIVNVSGNLAMLGQSDLISARLLITHKNEQQVSVTTLEPILVDSTHYNMQPALKTLAELAGLKTIAKKVPVSFHLIFDKQ